MVEWKIYALCSADRVEIVIRYCDLIAWEPNNHPQSIRKDSSGERGTGVANKIICIAGDIEWNWDNLIFIGQLGNLSLQLNCRRYYKVGC